MAIRFSRLHLSNWRNFKKVDVDLRERVFVVGANAAGKTNLLDAFRFLRDVAAPGGGLVRAVDERRGLKHLRSLHAGNDSDVVLEVDLRDAEEDLWTYRLELTGTDGPKRPLTVRREVVRKGQIALLDRSGAAEADARLLSQTHLEQVSQSLKFRPLVEALASVVHVHVVPQVVRSPARAEEFSRREAPGSDFIDQLAKLGPRQQGRALKRVEKLLRIAVPRFSELRVERDELGRPHLHAKYEHWRRRGGWQTEAEFSDGTLRLIGLLWAIDQGTAPLLLEEPELSLHREVIRQLPKLLAQASGRSGRQTIVSTHAEEMLADRGIDPSEILVLQPTDKETKVTPGSANAVVTSSAKAGVPLGRVVTSLTKPANIEQLSLPLN